LKKIRIIFIGQWIFCILINVKNKSKNILIRIFREKIINMREGLKKNMNKGQNYYTQNNVKIRKNKK
jgi:hypothetical protein